jgi:hypothetical protein
MKKAIKIDAVNRTVTEVEINDWQDIAPAIGADLFTCVDLGGGETLYVDDEGLLKNPEHFMMIGGYPEPIAGSGLILGTDEMGESKDTELTVELVRDGVHFISRAEARFLSALGAF